MARVTYEIPISFSIKVNANSSELSEQELIECVKHEVSEDLERDRKLLNGYAGCTTKDNRGFSYSYEAVFA